MIHEIDFIKDLPFYFTQVQIADPVCSEVRYLKLQQISTGLEKTTNRCGERNAEEARGFFAVDEHTCAFANIAEVNFPLMFTLRDLYFN